LIRLEPRLHPEGASGPTLAGEAVTDRDGEGIARRLKTELPAVAGSVSVGHGRQTYLDGEPVGWCAVDRRSYPMIEPGYEITWDEMRVGSRAIFANAGFAEVSRPSLRRVVMRIDF
jgi:hypothetical protein